MRANLVLMWLTVLAVALGLIPPVAVAEANKDQEEEGAAVVLALQAGPGGERPGRGDGGILGDPSPRPGPLGGSAGEASAVQELAAPGFPGPMKPRADERQTGPPAEPEAPVPPGPAKEPLFKPGTLMGGVGKFIQERAAEGPARPMWAQFQIPSGTREGAGPSKDIARDKIEKLPAALQFQYAYGSDSELTYLRNPDLNRKVKDDLLVFAPTFFGLMTYRPASWLEATMEMTAERQISLQEEDKVLLPDGQILRKEKRRLSLLVDQAYVTFKDLGPFEISIGRRNFEDERLFLYDAALDALLVKLKLGHFHIDGSVSRENLVDGELLFNPPTGSINNYMLYAEYRGWVDNKVAAYAILRDDRAGKEGRPLLLGARVYGRPTNRFNYWTDLGFARGRNELNQKLEGWGFDAGFTYRFPDLPLQPSVTLGAAFGSGDKDPNDNKSQEFRQTGLQSNEGRFGGVTQFKRFGEFLDPELSNIWILTAGVSFRLAGNAFLDLVYHYYRLDKTADQLRSSGVTAIMNQDDRNLSKEVGNEIDIILGFRNLFGLRRFGFEVRAGLFLPGKAYRIEEGNPDEPTYRKADPGMSVLSVFIW